MSRGTEMKHLVDDILDVRADRAKAAADRTKYVEDLQTTTSNILKDTAKAQRAMAKELKGRLKNEANRITRDTRRMIEGFHKDTRDTHAAWMGVRRKIAQTAKKPEAKKVEKQA